MKRSRYTGPSPAVRSKVRVRADHRCEWPACGRAGVQYHHRLNRKMGGRRGDRKEQINQASWLLYVCLTHHERVTSAVGEVLTDAKHWGWVLTENEDASVAAVHTSHGWVVLDDKGGYLVLPGPPSGDVPGRARGAPYPPPAGAGAAAGHREVAEVMEPRCTCTHSAALHGYGRRNGHTVRVACSASTCDCRQYTPGAPDDHCPTCGHRWSPLEVARIPMEET